MINPNVNSARCISCGQQRPFTLELTLCPACGGNLDLQYDSDAVRKQLTPQRLAEDPDHTLWRYGPLLPLALDEAPTPLTVGWTPLVPAPRLGRRLGLTRLALKDEGRNPSGSLKDRASAMVLAGALAGGRDRVVGASTGNAGSSMACLCASVGLGCVIFVPASAPRAKLAQLLSFGAQVVPVDGSYDQAFDLSQAVARRLDWYSRSTGYNPVTREGKKTCALEIWEQLGHQAPDWVFVSVGDGNIISGLHKGFTDLLDLGLIERLPRLAAVQSTASAAVARAVARLAPAATFDPRNVNIEPVNATTRADSISVDLPRDGLAAVRAVVQSGGVALELEDAQIMAAISLVSASSGVFGEPAGVASVAGLQLARQQGLVADDDQVVCVITGSGLKDVDAALATVDLPDPVPVDLEAIVSTLA